MLIVGVGVTPEGAEAFWRDVNRESACKNLLDGKVWLGSILLAIQLLLPVIEMGNPG